MLFAKRMVRAERIELSSYGSKPDIMPLYHALLNGAEGGTRTPVGSYVAALQAAAIAARRPRLKLVRSLTTHLNAFLL